MESADNRDGSIDPIHNAVSSDMGDAQYGRKPTTRPNRFIKEGGLISGICLQQLDPVEEREASEGEGAAALPQIDALVQGSGLAATRLGLGATAGSEPKPAPVSQPWAAKRNPVGMPGGKTNRPWPLTIRAA